MRILWTFCTYNEIEMLPYKMAYLRQEGIEPYVFDNMSTDGSWEWLRENSIPSEQFDSRNMFDLKTNLNLLHRKVHEAKPDWAIMAGADIFYVSAHGTLRETIELADANGFNCIQDGYRTFQFMFTGEEKPGNDPRLTYMHYLPKSLLAVCMAKYHPGLKFRSADYFTLPNQRPYKSDIFTLLHYSMRHDGRERKTEQYLRRKKAWDSGRTSKYYGAHYERLIRGDKFSFAKEELQDVRDSILWEPIRRSAA